MSKADEAIKEQEREAIRAAVAGIVDKLHKEGEALQKKLDTLSQEMLTYAQTTYANNIAGALEGQAADAASGYLSSIQKPDLRNPIK